jgi:energy-coupling factor transporter ATP-binding protein EcfA2
MSEFNHDMCIDGIKLDADNKEFSLALEYALNTNSNLYLTGKAGSGKTTFLKYLRKTTKKKMIVLAPTGIAAINAGGQTLHSFFQIAPSLYTPTDRRLHISTIYDQFSYNLEKRNIINNLEMLVIDEISMVRADLLDVVDTLLRVYRHNNRPFGGLQVILIGDTFQLPPVLKGEDKELLYQFYESEFFFSAKVIERCDLRYIELKKIYRQSEEDFINILNRIRVNQLLDEDLNILNSKLNPNFEPSSSENYITLTTTKAKAADVNDKKLKALQVAETRYLADITGIFQENIRPAETELILKVGAQVMFLKNDRDKRFFNGQIGEIIALNDDDIKVKVENKDGSIKEITALREDWRNIVYNWDNDNECIVEEEIGKFTQFPLRLAWAITVHKSQGLTFDRVIADIGNSFASGQVYVALSRCTSMNNLVLTSRINRSSIKVDDRVLRYANREMPDTLLTEQLSGSKADFYYAEARKSLRKRDAGGMLDNFYKAIRFRNDINTQLFKDYISARIQYLFRTENKYKDVCKQYEELQESFNNKSQLCDSQNAQIEELINRINLKDVEISRMSTELVRAKQNLNESQKEISSLKVSFEKQGEELNAERKNLLRTQTQLSETQVALIKSNKHNSLLETQIEALNKEIKRVSSITWYQKLFGKK